MAGFDYQRSKSTATRMLERFGQQMTLRHVTSGAYSAGEATLTVDEEVVQGVVDTYSNYEQANTLVEADDRRVTIAAEGLSSAPIPGDEITVGSAVGKIVQVAPLSPAGVTILYVLQARF